MRGLIWARPESYTSDKNFIGGAPKMLPLRCRVTPLLTGLLVGFSVIMLTAKADDLDNIIFEGALKDSAGAVLSGAKVIATHTATGVIRTAISNAEGRYRIAVSEP